MKIISDPHAAYAQVSHWIREGLSIGLVPTMGALHAGHISLVNEARAYCGVVAVSIFVNPTQFGPNEDFTRYPRTLENDLQLLREAKADLVFTPSASDIYPPGSSTSVEPPDVSRPLEGEFRPGHFGGVATVVLKLFHLLPASVAYFGQKDFQQCLVVQRMVEDLKVPIRIQVCPTLREADGLAMSSRNRYLNEAQRRAALCLWKALQYAKEHYEAGQEKVAQIEREMHAILLSEGADRIDYARIVDRETLEGLDVADRPAVALIAVHVGTTRLIDNLLLEPVRA